MCVCFGFLVFYILCSAVWIMAQRYVLYKKPKFMYYLINRETQRCLALNYVVILQHRRKNNPVVII